MTLPLFVWLLLSTIWGTTWLAIKLGLEDMPPFTFAGLRFLVAVSVLAIILRVRGNWIRPTTREWRLIAVTGFFTISVNYSLIFWAELHISSGLTAIFYSVFPLFGLVIAHFKLPGERMNVLKTAGVILGIMSVALIFSRQVSAVNPFAIWGSLAVVLAALATAYAGVLVKASGSHLDPLTLTVGQMIIGFPPLLLTGIVFEGGTLKAHWNASMILSLLYLALIGSALAFVLVYWLMQRMDVTRTQLIPLGSTLIAVILGKVILQESWDWRIITGGIGVLTGLAINVLGYSRKPA